MAGEFQPSPQDDAAMAAFERSLKQLRSGARPDQVYQSNTPETPLQVVPIDEVRAEISGNGNFNYEGFQDVAL
jgi:hypothetical protein